MTVRGWILATSLAAALASSCGPTAIEPAPAAPAGLTVRTTGLEPFISIAWHPSAGASSYALFRSTNSGATFARLCACIDPACVDTAVAASTRYVYEVKARNSGGESPSSDTASTRTNVSLILSPRDKQSVRPGDTVSVRIVSTSTAKAGLGFLVGPASYQLPNTIDFMGTFIPSATPAVRFVVPSFFTQQIWSDSLQDFLVDTISAVSDSCRIRMFDYASPARTLALSEGCFRIVNR